jgi:hypothetical protein
LVTLLGTVIAGISLASFAVPNTTVRLAGYILLSLSALVVAGALVSPFTLPPLLGAWRRARRRSEVQRHEEWVIELEKLLKEYRSFLGERDTTTTTGPPILRDGLSAVLHNVGGSQSNNPVYHQLTGVMKVWTSTRPNWGLVANEIQRLCKVEGRYSTSVFERALRLLETEVTLSHEIAFEVVEGGSHLQEVVIREDVWQRWEAVRERGMSLSRRLEKLHSDAGFGEITFRELVRLVVREVRYLPAPTAGGPADVNPRQP